MWSADSALFTANLVSAPSAVGHACLDIISMLVPAVLPALLAHLSSVTSVWLARNLVPLAPALLSAADHVQMALSSTITNVCPNAPATSSSMEQAASLAAPTASTV